MRNVRLFYYSNWHFLSKCYLLNLLIMSTHLKNCLLTGKYCQRILRGGRELTRGWAAAAPLQHLCWPPAGSVPGGIPPVGWGAAPASQEYPPPARYPGKEGEYYWQTKSFNLGFNGLDKNMTLWFMTRSRRDITSSHLKIFLFLKLGTCLCRLCPACHKRIYKCNLLFWWFYFVPKI